MMFVIKIFFSFLKIGIFAFGGAYAVIPLVEEQMVTNTGWMTFSEFSDLIAIDELTPGPIIINAATFIGMKLAGLPGAIAATLGCIMPGFIIVLTLICLYSRYKKIPMISEIINVLKCMSVALILSVLLKMIMNCVFPSGLNSIDILSLVMMTVGFFILKKYKPNPIFIILGCGTIGLIASLMGLK
ncbi:MAG: chromate transporter [Erysipelotrichaceae bacterium]|nr:chromate transporter [Erysipelotrichaceae bacterium]